MPGAGDSLKKIRDRPVDQMSLPCVINTQLGELVGVVIVEQQVSQ